MSLVLEIEFLAGVCRAAAHSPASATPEWPPQPDRVFSGLVSAWAVRGEQSSERRALEWLEAQSPPAIHAGRHTARTAPDVFVPPNDQRASTAVATYLKIMPRSRPRQPRRFPVAYLDDPVMALVWTAEPPPELLAALGALAHDVGYIGHSASLVRCRFLTGSAPALAHAAAPAVRQVYPGRLAGAAAGIPRQPKEADDPARCLGTSPASGAAPTGSRLAGAGGDRRGRARPSRCSTGQPHAAAYLDERLPRDRHGRRDPGGFWRVHYKENVRAQPSVSPGHRRFHRFTSQPVMYPAAAHSATLA